MKIFALELNNDLKGIPERKEYIEGLISNLTSPDLVLLPELALCSYIPNQKVWDYADDGGKDTSAWATEMAKKYGGYIGVGYADFENGDYFNRYMIAGADRVYGTVSKSEGEAAVFKRGIFGNLIKMPFGNVAVGICYDSRRKYFYENIKDEKISLIVFPHGSPADPKKSEQEQAANDFLCETYAHAFGVPVVYVNSVGKLEYMPGNMGAMMKKAGFRMNGKSKIYSGQGKPIPCALKEAKGMEIRLEQSKRKGDIRFYGDDLMRGNYLFRKFILGPDIKAGIKQYEQATKRR